MYIIYNILYFLSTHVYIDIKSSENETGLVFPTVFLLFNGFISFREYFKQTFNIHIDP